jgi:hypothetical protein
MHLPFSHFRALTKGPASRSGRVSIYGRAGVGAGALFHSKRSILLSLLSYVLPTVVHPSPRSRRPSLPSLGRLIEPMGRRKTFKTVHLLHSVHE